MPWQDFLVALERKWSREPEVRGLAQGVEC